MNIIFMYPVYKNYIWGGKRLKEEFNKNTSLDIIAESWEISSNENGICKIKNKEYEGKTLKNLFEDKNLKEKIFGKKCEKFKEFPLLIKFIDAKNNLSIQVHPDDKYAKKMGFKNGKAEMWYVMECEENGKIIGGLNSKITKEQLQSIIENDNIKDYLSYVDINKGDSIYIPTGTVHAILKNTLICEIQQNSDITYRVYDWDRKTENGKERQLHKKEALETIKIENKPIIVHSNDELEKQKIVESKFFKVEKINCDEFFIDNSCLDTFFAINVIEGQGIIETETNKYEIEKGESFLIPATLGKYKILGKIKLLKSYII